MILSFNGIISSSQIIYDTDALAFITAANITNSTQKIAVNQLVLDLKSANIWTKMKAIYPFVGGTASSHRFNLKKPTTNTLDHYITFNNGWTHSNLGALSNGIDAWAETNFSPSTSLSVNNTHTSLYVNNIPVAYTAAPGFGSLSNSDNTRTFYTHLTLSNTYYSFIGDEKGSASYGVTYSNTDSKSLGIVLTPPHIVELMVKLLDINDNDIVLDLCTIRIKRYTKNMRIGGIETDNIT
jgi:hypothetical protein